MADETKVKIDIGSVEDVGEKLGKGAAKGFKEGVEDAVESLNSGDLKKQFTKTFSVDGLKKDLAEGFKKGLAGSEKEQKRQKNMAGLLKKNAELSKKFTSSIASGASKSQVLSAGLKLAGNHVVGMLKGMNPYVAALKIAAETVKQFLENYQKALQASTKFVSSNSLLTDKATMSMMQRTGQSASGAQGTMRSLDRMGMSFEDLQSGQVTKAQMAMFEELRKAETERLESIAKVGGPVFEAMQKGAVAISTAKAQISDMFTFAYAKSKGVLQFAQSIQSFATQVGTAFWDAKDAMVPIMDFAGEIMSVVLDAIAPLTHSIKDVIKMVSGTFAILQPTIATIGGVIKELMKSVSSVISTIAKILGVYFKIVAAKISIIVQVVGSIIEAVLMALQPVFDIIEMAAGFMEEMLPIGKAMEALQPILQLVTTGIKILGAMIGWVVGKIGEYYKWLMTKTMNFIKDLVNMIPKAIHKMVEGIIVLLNKIPGVKIDSLGTYKEIDIAGALSKLNNAANDTLAAIQGDTFNYNYGTGTTPVQSAPVANQNLFLNTYTIVND